MKKSIKGVTIGELIEYLERSYTLKIVQHNDEWGHWRVGLDWFGDNDYYYICEQKELVDALWKAGKKVAEDIQKELKKNKKTTTGVRE